MVLKLYKYLYGIWSISPLSIGNIWMYGLVLPPKRRRPVSVDEVLPNQAMSFDRRPPIDRPQFRRDSNFVVASLGMDNPAGGLAINQLMKMKAKGLINLAQFLELTKDVEGFDEMRPI